MGFYNNPIIPGFNPDPSIVRVGPDYFLVTSTFEYFPGVPVYHSTDLINWTLIGHALTRRSQLDIRTPETGGGIWAPTIRWHDGFFYVTTACFDRYRPQADDRVWPLGFYVKTSDIWNEKSWSEPVFFDQLGFDQDLFWDDDGTAYLSTTYRKSLRTPVPAGAPPLKDFAVHVSTVDLATGAATSRPRLVRDSAAGSGVAEGSHLFKRGAWYYLFTAEGGTEGGHCEVVSRSRDGPFGPWEACPRGPVLGNGGEGEVRQTGHADLVEGPDGRWWAVFLGVRGRAGSKGGEWLGSVFGRETFLVPVTWEDDWPEFNSGKKVQLVGEAPGLFQIERTPAWRDDFETEEMQLGWYRKNTPVKKDFSLTERPGYLRLYGGPYTLSTPACQTMFLRKQIHDPVKWETRVSFRPDSPNTEAGAVVYWNQHTHSRIGIRMNPDYSKAGGRIIRFRPASGNPADVALASRDSDVVLTIKSDHAFVFGFKEVSGETKDQEVIWVGQVDSTVMTKDPPVGASFTGMMFGVYAFGEAERCFAPADFKYAEFQ